MPAASIAIMDLVIGEATRGAQLRPGQFRHVAAQTARR
jgi:hypothetical protein